MKIKYSILLMLIATNISAQVLVHGNHLSEKQKPLELKGEGLGQGIILTEPVQLSNSQIVKLKTLLDAIEIDSTGTIWFSCPLGIKVDSGSQKWHPPMLMLEN